MPRTIKVETICGRCGRTEEETMDMQEAMELDKKDEARDVSDKALESTINEVLDDTYPDVIIAVRNEDGSYTVKGQRNLCDQPSAKRNKGCATRVKALIADIFYVSKPKKPKTTPATSETPPATTTTPATEPATPKAPTNAGKKTTGPKGK